MTVTVRKAGEAIAKTAAKVGGSGSGSGAKMPVRPPRAISAAEAHDFQPARESTTTTMMPWKGWFQRYLKESLLGPEKFERLRRTMLFAPDDIYDLQQSPKPNQKIPISAADPKMTAMYRHPSPGSQKIVKLPEFEEGEDPYDTGYFKKDTRRRFEYPELGNPEVEKAKLALMDPEGVNPEVQEEMAKVEAGPASSPGNKGVFATGPSDFDPTGLRATMSVNWPALQKSLDANMPDHLPAPLWMKKRSELFDAAAAKGLPAPVGEYYAPMKVPYARRIATW